MTLNTALSLLLLSVLRYPALGAQQPGTATVSPAAQSSTTSPHVDLIATARAVLLDVVATDGNGQSVHGLGPSDFVVLEDGVQQRVYGLQEYPSKIVGAPIQKEPPNYFTNVTSLGSSDAWTVILIDAANNKPIVQDYVHGQLLRFMKTVPAGHPIAIFELDNGGMHLIQGFTSDPDVLLKAMESKRDRTEFTLRNLRARGYVPQQTLSDALQAMGRYLAGFPGRKNLIWLSGSIPGEGWGGGFHSPFPDRENLSTGLAGVDDALELNRVAVYPVDVRGLTPNPAFGGATSGIPSGAGNAAFGEGRMFENTYLKDIADRTGGKAFINTNGLRDAIGEVIETGSDYYTLAYAPTNRNWDGGRRAIEIKSSRGNLKLEYRHSYLASPEPVQPQSIAASNRAAAQNGSMTPARSAYRAEAMSAAHGFNAAMVLGAIPASEVLFGVSITAGVGTQKPDKNSPRPPGNYLSDAERGKPFRNYAVLFRITPNTLRMTPTPDGLHHGEVQLVVVVYDDKGAPVNSMMSTRKFSLTAAQYQGVMRDGGLTLPETVAVPEKGNFFFRFGVHDLTADHSGAFEIPVDNVQLGVLGPMQLPVP